MRRFLVVLLIITVSAFILLRVIRSQVSHDLAQPVNAPAMSPTPTVVIDRLQNTVNSLFVPSWTLDSISTASYDQYIYFGISPTASGYIATGSGEQGIDSFVSGIPQGKRTLLALEMENTDVNGAILKTPSAQKRLISQTLSLAKENGFSGVVLDLEMGGIPFSSLIDEINSFTKDFDEKANAQQVTFDVTLYGDTFYRLRPFDVKTIASHAHMIMIMAYDFNKARSNPGPNFPLSGQNVYGYDMGKMTDDFLQSVPNQKLAVIFGLFGYDWPVDDKGNGVGVGVPLTDLQIQNKFLNNCKFTNCQIKRDSLSGETEIHYTDDNNQKHIVWFEDMQSVNAKEQYLQKRGVGNFSFWANSYF